MLLPPQENDGCRNKNNNVAITINIPNNEMLYSNFSKFEKVNIINFTTCRPVKKKGD